MRQKKGSVTGKQGGRIHPVKGAKKNEKEQRAKGAHDQQTPEEKIKGTAIQSQEGQRVPNERNLKRPILRYITISQRQRENLKTNERKKTLWVPFLHSRRSSTAFFCRKFEGQKGKT